MVSSKDKKFRIFLINQFFPPDFAPTGQLLDDLSKRICSQKLLIHIFTGYPKYAFKNKKILNKNEKYRKIYRTKFNQIWPFKIGSKFIGGILFSIRAFNHLALKLKKNDIVIYTSEPAYLPLFGWFLSLIRRHKYIVIIYDLYPDVLTNLKVLSHKNPLIICWKNLNKLCYQRAKNIVVLSDPMKNKLNSNIRNINSKIRVIPSWVDPEFIKPIPKSENWFIEKHNLKSKFVVLYSGNQGRCHDLMTIMNTAKKLLNESNIVFLFIGDGAQNTKLRDYACKYNLKNCKFLPYQNFEDTRFSLTAADLACISLNKNASDIVAPSKLYGHLAAGSPIAAISSKNSYLAELVLNKGFGKHFENGSCDELSSWILELNNPKFNTKIYRETAREYIKSNASPKVVTGKYLDAIFENIYS